MYSPDGRIYQVEYAIETVKRGTLAIGVCSKEGIIIAVEEKPRTLQTTNVTQKIFQVDYHIGVAAAGYIPDARVQVDNARFFSQGNRMTYDESVEVATVAKHLADQAHQFTQYGGVRPNGVSMIIAGIDQKGESIYVTDPSGTYVQFAAVAIGAGSDEVNSFLEKHYKEGINHIKMAKITTESKIFEKVSESDLQNYSQKASKFAP
jgi:proteasome alpha subunit